MDGRLSVGARPHLVRVRSAAGDVWEAAVQWIYSPELVARVAVLVRDFLIRPVIAPAWVHVLRTELLACGVELAACVVEVARATDRAATRWRVVAEVGVCATCSFCLPASATGRGGPDTRGSRSSLDQSDC